MTMETPTNSSPSKFQAMVNPLVSFFFQPSPGDLGPGEEPAAGAPMDGCAVEGPQVETSGRRSDTFDTATTRPRHGHDTFDELMSWFWCISVWVQHQGFVY